MFVLYYSRFDRQTQAQQYNNILYSPLLYHTSNSVDVIFLWFLFHPMIYLRYYKSIKLYIGVPAMA